MRNDSRRKLEKATANCNESGDSVLDLLIRGGTTMLVTLSNPVIPPKA